ncbi:MAG: DUF4493 domain-containing protein [Muribaculum sp.]|nr:DUF4493 domain-containing protein [Muribaculum sp.]
MKHNIYTIIISAAIVMTGLASCEKESAFALNEGEGMLDCESMTVEYINGGRQVRSAEDNVTVDKFMIKFVNSSNDTISKYGYTKLPTVVSLPVGEYTIHAEYGNDVIAEWDSPFFHGKSEKITIESQKIKKHAQIISCKLSNIRVAVNFDNLTDVKNPQVKVVAGEAKDNASLNYTPETQAEGKIGYFKVGNSSTISATFSGTVTGADGMEKQLTATQTFDKVQAGNAYTINFKVNNPVINNDGNITIGNDDGNNGFTVDATITISDQTEVVDPDKPVEDIIKDMYPQPTGETEEQDNTTDNQ